MVDIDELRITNNGNYLSIKAHVDTKIWQDSSTIDMVVVGTGESYNGSCNPISTDKVAGNVVNNFTPQASISLKLKLSDLYHGDVEINGSRKQEEDFSSFTESLIFVYFRINGSLKDGSCTPCGIDEIWWLGVTVYMGDIYNNFMQYIKLMNNDCQIPKDLIDLILKFKAVTTAIDSGHYTEGINYYNKFFKEGGANNTPVINCGCHG